MLNAVFRAERYAASHPGLAGRNLEGQGVLEITDEVVQCPEPTCAADLNGNYLVDVADLLNVLGAFGCNLVCPQDVTGNGAVGVDDILFILSEVGHPCPY